jgi:stress-induced morphogen
MADDSLKKKIYNVMKETCFTDPDDLVDVSDGTDDDVYLLVVSRKFDGKRMKEKHDLLWSILVDRLEAEEWGKVSLSVGTTPEEILKAM